MNDPRRFHPSGKNTAGNSSRRKNTDQIRQIGIQGTRFHLKQEQKQRKSKLQKLRSALSACEKEIGRLEQKCFEIDEFMTHQEIATNSARLNELSAEKQGYEDKLAELYEEWESRSEELQSFENGEDE